MLIHKVISLHLIKCMYRRISSDMLRSLTIHVMLQDKNIRSKVLLRKLRKNGKALICLFNLTKRLSSLKEPTLYLLSCKNIWVFYQTKRQDCFMKTSKIKSNCGKIIYKEYQKLYKCWLKSKDNGFIFKLFLPLNKTKIDNWLVISTNSNR